MLVIALGSGSGSCSSDTSLRVVVEAGPGVPAILSILDVAVLVDDEVVFANFIDLGPTNPLPQSFVLEPGSQESETLLIAAVGRQVETVGPIEVARAVATAEFELGRQTTVTMTLAPSCVEIDCPSLEWCEADQCVPRPCHRSDECSDGLPCNGDEQCLAGICQPGQAPICDDGDPCTEDLCLDSAGGCLFEPEDLDGDDFAAEDCGGRDCDDTDPLINPDAIEQCDGVDQNCDGSVDETFDCALGEVGPCTTSCGTSGEQECESSCVWGECVSTGEECNYIDDDCDGLVDEGLWVAAGTLAVSSHDEPTREARVDISLVAAQLGVVWLQGPPTRPELYFSQHDMEASWVPEAPLRITDRDADPGAIVRQPDIVARGSFFVVVWTREDQLESSIRAQVVDTSSPSLLGPSIQLSAEGVTATKPDMAGGDDAVGAVWIQGSEAMLEGEVFFSVIDTDSGPDVVPTPITAPAEGVDRPVIVWTGTEYGIAWQQIVDEHSGVFFASVGSTGGILTGPEQVSGHGVPARDVSLTWNGSAYVVVWSDERDGTPRVYGAALDAEGLRLGDDVELGGPNTVKPLVRSRGDHMLVALHDRTGAGGLLWVTRYAALDHPLGSPLEVATGADINLTDLDVWSNWGVVAWDDSSPGSGTAFVTILSCPIDS